MTERRRRAADRRERRARPVQWVAIATYRSGWEAEIGRAVLQAGGFDAVVQGGEWVGIFGLAFQGSTPRGVTVIVPSHQLAAARTYLAFREEQEADAERGVTHDPQRVRDA